MNGYQAFAAFYDRLTTDVEYASRATYLLDLFQCHVGKVPASLLDVGCGSGSLAVELAGRGIDMIGADLSEDMLAIATEKAAEQGRDILFLCQDMRELDLYGTVEGAVCTLDSLNHLLRTADLEAVFQRLRLFIEPGGLFIFDVNTPYKHRVILENHAFVLEEDGCFCVWRNRLISRTCEVEMLLDFFVEVGTGYERLTDSVRERAYSRRTLERMLMQNGFSVEGVYQDMTDHEPGESCERWVFVTRRL